MALSTKDILDKNKLAYKNQFYIESTYLSYSLMTRILKQISVEEKITAASGKLKLSELIKQLKGEYDKSPLFTKKLKKSIFKNICEFNSDFKLVSRELKYQYPEIKLKHTAKKGLDVLVKLNTTLIKLKSNNH